MLLYWGMFTVGFIIGVGIVLAIFRENIFSERAVELEEKLELDLFS